MSDTFEYTHLAHLDSSAISDVAYSNPDETLFVRFNGGAERVYNDVGQHVYDELVAASSAGRYFNREVMGEYTSTPYYHTDLVPSRKPVSPTVNVTVDPGVIVSANQLRENEGFFTGTYPQPDWWDIQTNPTLDIPRGDYGVKYSIVNTLIVAEPRFQATGEDDALSQFNDAIEASLPGLEVKVLAVTHYFE